MRLPFFWNELNTYDLAGLDPERTIAVLPIASTEQHGPHLPLGTDTMIAQGMLTELRNRGPADPAALVLPLQEVGKANEHIHGPGTLSLGARALIEDWTAIGASVARSGLRKLVIVNSHGGNVDIMRIVARELRVMCNMAVVSTQWEAFGHPEGLIAPDEGRLGIHGGDIETSLMLHFRPELVRMGEARDFTSTAADMEAKMRLLRPIGGHALAWLAHDLNPQGAIGNASSASAEKGNAICSHQVSGFIELLGELADWPLARLYSPGEGMAPRAEELLQ